MWGADDPDCRKPMLWNEFEYDDEIAHPCNIWEKCNFTRPVDKVEVDQGLLNFYKSLIDLRQNHPTLRYGTIEFNYIDDKAGVFAFTREYEGEKIIAVFNSSFESVKFSNKILPGCDKKWKVIVGKLNNKIIAPKSYVIFLN